MEISDVIESVVNTICPVFKGTTEWVEVDKCFEIETCDTFYLREFKKLTINGVNYRIKKVDPDKKLVLEGTKTTTPKPSLTEFPIYKPKYFHGEPIAVTKQLIKIETAADKMPMIWFLEANKKDDYSKVKAETRDSVSEIVMFFMDTNDFGSFNTEDHYRACLRPMSKLVDLFVDKLVKNRAIFGINQNPHSIIGRVNFGAALAELGREANWTEVKISGQEYRHKITITKQACKICPK